MELTQSQERSLRRAFRYLNHNMLLMWRLGLRRIMASRTGGFVMVLGTTGRKSAEHRLAPLNFAERDDRVYCLAGFGKTTHWLLNLQADSRCEVWLPDGRRLSGIGVIVANEPDRIARVQEILTRSGFAAKLVHPGLDLSSASDEEIASLGIRPGVKYEAVEIKLGQPVTGPGGPGDLAWVLPASAIAGVATWLTVRRFRQSRRSR